MHQLTENNFLEIEKKFNLSYHIRFAYSCQKHVGFEGKDVLEVGGSLPKEFVFDYLHVKSWSAIESPDYETELREAGGVYHQGTSLHNLGQNTNNLGFENRLLTNYNLFFGNIEELPADYYQQYDLVFSICAFEHINKLPAALDKMFLSLKPAGKLFTYFAPIWSSYNGHHLPQITDQKGNVWQFTNDANNSLIPPWGHLLMRPPELCKYLYEFTDEATVHLITYYVYNSNHINRFFVEDYVDFINQSPFEINRIEGHFISSIPPEIQEQLEHLYPGRTKFSNGGILAILEKP